MTNAHDDAVGNPDERVAYATWIRIFGGATRGLTHALGNRLHAVEMTLGSIEPGEAVPPAAASALDLESAGCAELVRLYRMLPLSSAMPLEACRVADVIPDAVALFGHHVDGRDALCTVDVRGEPPAILVPPIALTQALLVVLCSVVAGADEGSSPIAFIKVAGEDDAVRIDIHSVAPPKNDEIDAAVIASGWILSSSHIGVTRTAGASAIRLELPSLAAARRREKAAS